MNNDIRSSGYSNLQRTKFCKLGLAAVEIFYICLEDMYRYNKRSNTTEIEV